MQYLTDAIPEILSFSERNDTYVLTGNGDETRTDSPVSEMFKHSPSTNLCWPPTSSQAMETRSWAGTRSFRRMFLTVIIPVKGCDASG